MDKKYRKPKIKESPVVQMFAELMPEVRFVDVTPKPKKARKQLEKKARRIELI